MAKEVIATCPGCGAKFESNGFYLSLFKRHTCPLCKRVINFKDGESTKEFALYSAVCFLMNHKEE